MMNNIRVPLFSIDKVTTVQEFSAKRTAPKWLLRIFQWAYNWLGDFITPSPAKSVSYHRVEIKFDKYYNDIRQHVHEIERDTGQRPRYLFMGHKEYYEMTGQVMNDYPLMLGPFPEEQLQLFGLRIIIVPWIEGLFCLPDLDKMR